MPFVFSQTKYCDMHFVCGFCGGNTCAAVVEYRRHYPNQKRPLKGVFSSVHLTMPETGCLPSVCVQSDLTYERIFLRW